MIALIQRILRLAEGYRTRIRLAAVCSFVKAFLGKAPIVIAYFMIKGFIENSVTGKTCLLAGAALVLCLALIVTLVFYGIGEAMKKNTLMHSAERQAAAQQVTDAVIDFTEGIGIIKTYNLMGEKSEELTEAFAANRDKNIAFEKDYTPWSVAINSTYGIGSAAMLALSWFLYLDGTLSLAMFIGMLLFIFELFRFVLVSGFDE